MSWAEQNTRRVHTQKPQIKLPLPTATEIEWRSNEEAVAEDAVAAAKEKSNFTFYRPNRSRSVYAADWLLLAVLLCTASARAFRMTTTTMATTTTTDYTIELPLTLQWATEVRSDATHRETGRDEMRYAKGQGDDGWMSMVTPLSGWKCGEGMEQQQWLAANKQDTHNTS